MSITKDTIKETIKTIMAEEGDYKAFFNKIDAAWDGKGEKNEELTDKQKQLDIDGDGEIEASDLAALRAGEKVEESHDCGCGCGGVTEGGCSTNISEGKHDKTLDKLADLVKGAKSFMDIGKELKKAKIKDYHFSTSMLPMYVINIGGAKVAILNKKYTDGAERIVGTTAIGLMESVIESLNEEPVAVSMRNDDGSITTTIKEVADLNEEESKLYEFGLKVEKALMNEKNCPTDPGKWAASKAAAKKKFDVYPSAYANGWAAKNYKGKGGGWRKCKG